MVEIFSLAKIIHYHRSPPQRAERINQLKMSSNLPFLLKNSNVFKNNILSSRNVPKGAVLRIPAQAKPSNWCSHLASLPLLKKKIQLSEDQDVLFVKTRLYDFYFFHCMLNAFYFSSAAAQILFSGCWPR